MGEAVELDLVRNDEASRYEAWSDGEVVGFAEFRTTDTRIMFTHTVVEQHAEGHGVASALARYALDDVRQDGTRMVVPRCPFFRGWIDGHPEYQDLLLEAARPETNAGTS